MSTSADGVETYAQLWRMSAFPRRWVLRDTAGDVLVFDRDTNCPVDIDDGPTRGEVLRRMREAGVPEGDEYPGRPCA
ncbi:hypothetical protein [Streptomyces ortus]|uniref:Uncharacterized protein n=1 Tax=Streptomyces ortus TaxID=2867268 RepID=A0ABT3VD21_9ACTN|nr:hypothetical protein [Streptomyces ortus]MCX4237832.1 hypothetical protein [Streptomyces ortus]